MKNKKLTKVELREELTQLFYAVLSDNEMTESTVKDNSIWDEEKNEYLDLNYVARSLLLNTLHDQEYLMKKINSIIGRI